MSSIIDELSDRPEHLIGELISRNLSRRDKERRIEASITRRDRRGAEEISLLVDQQVARTSPSRRELELVEGFRAARQIRERQEQSRRRDDQQSIVERDAAMLIRRNQIQEIRSCLS